MRTIWLLALCSLFCMVEADDPEAPVLPPPPEPVSKLDEELRSHSSYVKQKPYSQVRDLLQSLRNKNMAKEAPDASRRGPNSGGGQIEDETELSKNKAILNDVFEGDIVLTVEQAQAIVEATDTGRAKRKVVSDTSYRWPQNTIYYVFTRGLANYKVTAIREAIRVWQENTCLSFQEGYGRGDYLTFISGSGCYSNIGRTGGEQVVSIGDGCESVYIVCHEIGHALDKFYHEQSRTDRDSYISIFLQNVMYGTAGNFIRASSSQMNDYGVPYDYGSVLHYGSQAFSYRSDLYTIRTLNQNYQRTIGQRFELTFADVKQINKAYCSAICPNSLACQRDGYANPANGGRSCGSCRCPHGLSGTSCETVEPSNAACGGVLQATGAWQEINSPSPRTNLKCNWLLKAPTNGRVILEVSSVNLKCKETCSDYLEIKPGPTFVPTGFRLCCANSWTNPTVSNGQEMIVIYKINSNINGGPGVRFRFRTDAVTSTARTTEPVWTGWSGWSGCSVSCGGCGRQARRRDCTNCQSANSTTQTRVCGEQPCITGATTIDAVCRYAKKIPCDNESRHRRWANFRRRRATQCSENVDYLCFHTSPNFIRKLSEGEMKTRVKDEWKPPTTRRATQPCCAGYEEQKGLCVQRRL